MQKYSSIIVIFSVVLWGASFPFAKMIAKDINPYELNLLRLGLAALFAIPIMLYRRSIIKKENIFKIWITSFTSFPLALILQFWGLKYVTASLASLAVGLEGVIVMLWSWFLFKVKPKRLNLLVALISILGLIFIIGIPDVNKKIGIAFIMASNLVVGFSIVYTKKIIQDINPIDCTLWQILFAGITMIPIMFIFSPETKLETFSKEVIWVGIYLGVFCTTIAYIGYNIALKYLSAARTAQFIVIEPVVGVLLAVSLLGETLTFNIALGTIFIAVGMIINAIMTDGNENV